MVGGRAFFELVTLQEGQSLKLSQVWESIRSDAPWSVVFLV